MTIPGYWLGNYYCPDRSRAVQYPVGWGTLGYALPASVGAAFASDLPVLAVCGDGGVMFALGELATIAQEHLAVTVLVVDDGGYGMLRYGRQEGVGRKGVGSKGVRRYPGPTLPLQISSNWRPLLGWKASAYEKSERH